MCRLLGALPLADGFRVPEMRRRPRLRGCEAAALAMCRLPIPGLADRRNGSPQQQDPAQHLVLGRLRDGDRPSRRLGVLHPRPVRAGLQVGLASPPQTPPRYGRTRAHEAHRRHRDGRDVARWLANGREGQPPTPRTQGGTRDCRRRASRTWHGQGADGCDPGLPTGHDERLCPTEHRAGEARSTPTR